MRHSENGQERTTHAAGTACVARAGWQALRDGGTIARITSAMRRGVQGVAAAGLVVATSGCFDTGSTGGTTGADNTGSTTSTASASVSSVGAMQVSGPIGTADAIRFLEQAGFGADDTTASAVMELGFGGWIDEQLRAPRTILPTPDPIHGNYDVICRDRYVGANDTLGSCLRDFYTSFPVQTAFFRKAVGSANDQLRLRTAFALSQILVTSGLELKEAYAVAAYQQLLVDNAFGNFRTLLKEVTLSAPMGKYLNLADSAKADPARGTQPNENYPRELLQLFSLGPVLLNEDGTVKKDANGRPLPTYDQTVVKETARALTGWTFAKRPGWQPGLDYPNTMLGRMEAAPWAHDTGAKTVVGGRTIPAGQTPEQDVDAVIDAVMRHPNVGPFIGRQLIQFMVTGNPSPGYVTRVTRVFNDNGSGVKGDLAAVVRAVLLDEEARRVPTGANAGRVREPVLFVTNVLRQLGARTDGVWPAIWARTMGQPPFDAPSVFNFYPSDYATPGSHILAPQFKTLDPGALLARSNFLNELLFSGTPAQPQSHTIFSDASITRSTGTTIDLSRWEAVAGDANGLVDALGARLLAGRMSDSLRRIVVNAVDRVNGDRTRAALAIYLIAASPEYQVAR